MGSGVNMNTLQTGDLGNFPTGRMRSENEIATGETSRCMIECALRVGLRKGASFVGYFFTKALTPMIQAEGAMTGSFTNPAEPLGWTQKPNADKR